MKEKIKRIKQNGVIITSIIVLALVVSVIALFISLNSDQGGYSPDRNDWARLVIKNSIMDTTDLWRTRYAVDVRIFDEDKTIGVLITAANGEEPIDNPDYFRGLFKPRIESLIEEFDWLKDYQIVLTIL